MSSKRCIRRKSCKGKVKHKSRIDAIKAMTKTRQKGESRMHAYRCKFCGGWHIGHMTYQQKNVFKIINKF